MNIYGSMPYIIFLITTYDSTLCLCHLIYNHGLVLHYVCLSSMKITYDAIIHLLYCIISIDHVCHCIMSVSSPQDLCYSISASSPWKCSIMLCCVFIHSFKTMFNAMPYLHHILDNYLWWHYNIYLISLMTTHHITLCLLRLLVTK